MVNRVTLAVITDMFSFNIALPEDKIVTWTVKTGVLRFNAVIYTVHVVMAAATITMSVFNATIPILSLPTLV